MDEIEMALLDAVVDTEWAAHRHAEFQAAIADTDTRIADAAERDRQAVEDPRR